MAIVMYTIQTCPYCDQAKALLDRKKAQYEVIDVTNNPEKRQDLIEKSNGLKTVPQIFIDDQYIGGFDALQKFDMQGKLDALIQHDIAIGE